MPGWVGGATAEINKAVRMETRTSTQHLQATASEDAANGREMERIERLALAFDRRR